MDLDLFLSDPSPIHYSPSPLQTRHESSRCRFKTAAYTCQS